MKKSQAAVIGFMVAGAFVVIVMTLLAGVFNRMVEEDTTTYDLKEEAKFVAEVFSNPGFPEDWDSTNVKKIGVKKGDSISSTAIEELAELPYQELKSKIGGVGKDFIFFFQDESGVIAIDDKEFWGWNADIYPEIPNGGYNLGDSTKVIVNQAANVVKEEVLVKLDSVQGVVKAVIYTWDEKVDFLWVSCNDGFDNDGDSLVDWPEDPGCSDPETETEKDPDVDPECSDGSDNDGNGDTDFPIDPDCDSAADKSETGAANPMCSNGFDTDGDGWGEWPTDPGCISAADDDENDDPGTPECFDQKDNDDDGFVDWPEDPGCTSRGDKSEKVPPTEKRCSNFLNDDGDPLNLIDMTDPGCESGNDNSETPDPIPTPDCNDGGDNDIDLLTDLWDPGCYGPGDDDEEGPKKTPPPYIPECSDGKDNDGDGYIDYPYDPGCRAAGDFSEKNPKILGECFDGMDNNANGARDFPADYCCYAASDPWEDGCAPPQCSDTSDNDGDTVPDYPWDPGCYAASDNDERDPVVPPECADGLDNDQDGWIDFPWDPGCFAAGDPKEQGNRTSCSPLINKSSGFLYNFLVWWPGCYFAGSNTTNASNKTACANWTDDDGDNYTDYPWDPGCVTPLDNNESEDPNNLPQCNNSIDDDLDLLIDFPKDPGCAYAGDPNESNSWTPPPGGSVCGNGILEQPPETCETDVDCRAAVPAQGHRCILCGCYNVSHRRLPGPPFKRPNRPPDLREPGEYVDWVEPSDPSGDGSSPTPDNSPVTTPAPDCSVYKGMFQDKYSTCCGAGSTCPAGTTCQSSASCADKPGDCYGSCRETPPTASGFGACVQAGFPLDDSLPYDPPPRSSLNLGVDNPNIPEETDQALIYDYVCGPQEEIYFQDFRPISPADIFYMSISADSAPSFDSIQVWLIKDPGGTPSDLAVDITIEAGGFIPSLETAHLAIPISDFDLGIAEIHGILIMASGPPERYYVDNICGAVVG